jgi:pimeloyl-ACP methyl ester carboxylesterase
MLSDNDDTRYTAKLSAGDIQYQDIGDGEAILFIHGLFLNGRIWTDVANNLSQEHRCIVPELPFGAHPQPMNEDADLSPQGTAHLVAEFIDSLNLSKVTLVGVDFGGVVAKLVAARLGENVHRLVITNCDALEVFPAKGFGYLKWLPSVPGAMWIMAQFMYRFKVLRHSRTSFGAFIKFPVPDSLLKSFVQPLATTFGNRRDAGKLMRGIDPNLTLALPDEIKKSGTKTLVLWGADDQLFTMDLARRLTNAIGKQAALREVKNAKAFISLDAPEVTAAEIRAFMQSTNT